MTIPTTKSEINEALKSGYVEIKFTKVNGQTRTMLATLLSNVVSEVAEKNGKSTASVRQIPDHQVCCIDAELGEWRRCRIDSITSFEPKVI